tara:strand:+ start:277 stop:648 length:372 start_codon:yes stop_codon:yes gene_type:complete
MSEKISALVEQVGNLTMQEAADMAKMMEEKWGINYSTILSGAQAPVAEKAVDDTTATVVLRAFKPGQKIPIIKAIRPILELGLLEAKTYVEDLPKVVKDGLEKEEVDKLVELLEAAGGEVEIK